MLWCDKRGKIKLSLVHRTRSRQRKCGISASSGLVSCQYPLRTGCFVQTPLSAVTFQTERGTERHGRCPCGPFAMATWRSMDGPQGYRNEGEGHKTAARRLCRPRAARERGERARQAAPDRGLETAERGRQASERQGQILGPCRAGEGGLRPLRRLLPESRHFPELLPCLHNSRP
jgi:hypothetical protein